MAGLTPGLVSSGTCECNGSISVFKQVTQYISPAHSSYTLQQCLCRNPISKFKRGRGEVNQGYHGVPHLPCLWP